jgi:uncharacterized membrane protein
MFTSLLPDPLHAAIVHMPIALAVLFPLFAVGALVAIRRGVAPRGAWGLAVALAAMLAASALIAKETGEDGEERVENLVPKAALEAHEDAADRFVVVVLAVLAVSAVGLRRDRLGAASRLVATLGTVAVLATGYAVGKAGGELTYRHGAAAAYASGARAGVGAGGEAGER